MLKLSKESIDVKSMLSFLIHNNLILKKDSKMLSFFVLALHTNPHNSFQSVLELIPGSSHKHNFACMNCFPVALLTITCLNGKVNAKYNILQYFYLQKAGLLINLLLF